VIRFLASLFESRWQYRHGNDALGEYLRSSSYAEMTPEILLRIL
jgi:hypothetical protein